MIRDPAFWWAETPTAAARLLQPLGALYGALTARRMARSGLRLPVPVLCVGNLVAGGAGKTPTALALAAQLMAQGHRPAFLSRGYGGRASRAERDRVTRVDLARHDAATVGDEPLLLAAQAPTYVAADRRASGRVAVEDGATILLLDDGLQNPGLAKTLTLAVVDGATGFGNGLCVPAGPLRAPPAAQWPAVNALCLIGDGHAGERVAAMAAVEGRPVLRARLVAEAADTAMLRGTPLVAFAAIGRPQKFFATLAAYGLDICERRSFPDHHPYSAADRAALLSLAATRGARLVTTAKDRTRLPNDFPTAVLPVSLAFDDSAAVERLLAPFNPFPNG